MFTKNFFKKKVLVMGLGLQGGGVGVAKFFVEHGAEVTVTDLKTEKELTKSLRKLKLLKNKPKFVLGKHREEDFKKTDLVIRNPDVSRNSLYLKIAKDHGARVEMDESLFLQLCPDLDNVIGVTGTRGKTTTTHLIGAILKEAGLPVLLGGNLRGVATLSLLEQITLQTKIVLELSSWQLQSLDESRISPHLALITNIYPDHLNRYKSMEEYVEDKKIIFKYQNKNDYLFLNKKILKQVQDDILREAKAKIVWFTPEDVPLEIRKSFKLPGTHNLENLAAAYKIVKTLGVSDMVIERAVKNFKGVQFRLEKIAEIDGVTYINDTTSTTPIATIMALAAFTGRSIILICGGASKNLDMTELGKEIRERVKAVVLLEGTATDELEEKIQQNITDSGQARMTKRILKQVQDDKKETVKILGRFDNFEKAIIAAKNEAKPGDLVLLSPAAASFGMFVNEFDRGEKFNEIVKKSREKN